MIIDSEEQVLRLYSQEGWSMSKLGRKSEFSYSKVRRMIIESNEVDKRSHKEACSTDEFKESLKEANEGSTLSEEHRESISEGIRSSEKFQKAMKSQSERLRKDVNNEELKELYFELDENARKVSEKVGLSHRQVLSRLKEEGVDTSKNKIWNKGQSLSDEHKNRLSEAKKGKTWEELFGEEHAEWRRKNIGEKISKAKKGYTRKPEVVAKLRKKRIEEIEQKRNNGNQIFPSYNKSVISVIEEFGEKNGYDFQHAENGGEYFVRNVGCWVDGYDNDKDVVVEVYEPYHYECGELRDKDLRRERDIKEIFQPNKFYRIKIDDKSQVINTLEI